VNLYNNAVLLSDAKFKQNITKKVTKSWQNQNNKFKDYVRSVLPSYEPNTRSKFFAPLMNSHVDSRLFKAASNFNQPLLQFIDGVDFPSDVTKALDAETEAKTEAVASETETEAEAQGSWTILFAVQSSVTTTCL